MKELFVVVHPEATHHVEDRVGGWFDSELTERGREQAARLAARFTAEVRPGVQSFSSDLRRTAQTAVAIAETVRVAPIWLEELREKSYGVGEGQPDTWLREKFLPPPHFGERMDHDERIAGAETKLQWATRIYRGMDKILSGSASQAIVVTHGGSATYEIAHWIGMPLESLAYVSFKATSGSITHLVEDDYFHNRTVSSLSDTAHLEP